jgi:hypothetical protein
VTVLEATRSGKHKAKLIGVVVSEVPNFLVNDAQVGWPACIACLCCRLS